MSGRVYGRCDVRLEADASSLSTDFYFSRPFAVICSPGPAYAYMRQNGGLAEAERHVRVHAVRYSRPVDLYNLGPVTCREHGLSGSTRVYVMAIKVQA